MKKKSLLAIPLITATEEMKQAALADLPKKEKTSYGYTREKYEYYSYLKCIVQDGILKVAFFLPEHLRLDGNNPVYEVYLDQDNRQFVTYDCLQQKWRESKLDRLTWHPYYSHAKTSWVSEEDAAVIRKYLDSKEGNAKDILHFQWKVREEQLEKRHRRETDPWDKDMEQVPELPKDWVHWVDKVAIRENYIFYHYRKGGAKTGYCTYCGKEVPISGHPYHNKKGRCSRCRHTAVFKAYGRAGYIRTEEYTAYLIQQCRDGFIIREFQADRVYKKDKLPQASVYCHEIRRIIYDKEMQPRKYYWGFYKQRDMRWIKGILYRYDSYWIRKGRVYGRSLPYLERNELRYTNLVPWIRREKLVDPEFYLGILKDLPQLEQISKAGLPKLTRECFKSADSVKKRILNPEKKSLIKALGLDTARFQRFRTQDGGCDLLEWLQYEKGLGKIIPDDILSWMCMKEIRPQDITFVADRMSMVQVYNYLQKQSPHFHNRIKEVLSTWEDYLSMARKLHMDVYDEIVYKVKKLRQRHDELVIQCQEKDLEIQAEEVAKKFPHVDAICQEIREKYEYTANGYTIIVPNGILDIITEGRALHHCVDSSDKYWDRIEQKESFILFLRKAKDPAHSYYTLEVEPDGTVRQKRTEYDRQKKDIEKATKFLKKWQTVINARLTEGDRKLADKSRVLREKEFVQLRENQVIIHTGHLAGSLLVDVLMKDLMENTECIKTAEMKAAA